jgi:hypothetical protein
MTTKTSITSPHYLKVALMDWLTSMSKARITIGHIRETPMVASNVKRSDSANS